MKRLSIIVALFIALIAAPAWALDLQQARSSGLVGEKPDGYIAAVQASPEVNALVASVNAQRQQEYARIAKEKGQTVDVVAKLAAPEIIGKLGAGQYYQGSDGAWKKR